MKKYILGFVLLVAPFSPAQAAALTTQQANSLIAVVQSSPGTPASAFVSLITAFSNITVNQASSLITVVQASLGTPASAFVDLLTSFTVDPLSTQSTNTTTQSLVTPPATVSPTNSTTVTSIPTATLSPQTQTVSYGSTATVSWSSTNATECSLYDSLGSIIKSGSTVRGGFGGNYANGSINTQTSTTYTYGCNNATGGTGWKYAYVTVCMQGQTVSNGACVNPITVQPVINSVSVSSAAPGTSVKLYTTNLPPNSSYYVEFGEFPNNTSITATMDASGVVTFVVPESFTVKAGTYQIRAGASLTSYKTNSITFTIEAPQLPEPVLGFTLPDSVTFGGRVIFTWLAQNATGCTMTSSPNDAIWNSLSGAMGGGVSSYPIAQTTTYTLTCTNGTVSVTKDETVTVN